MPRKSKFTKEMIINGAFKVVREQGWSNLSARTIAGELKSSTMPLYSYLKSMEEIEAEIRKRTIEILFSHQMKKYTEKPFLNMAVGYIVFAREEKNLFKFLFLERPKPLTKKEMRDFQKKMTKDLDEEVSLEFYFGEISVQELDDISLKSWIFTHGLAIALSYGQLIDISDDEIANLLEEAGGAFVRWTGKKK